MGKLRFINNFDTQLSADALPGDTILDLLDASPLGSLANGDYYCATITNGVAFEVVHITAISGTQITVTRAQEGTTALTVSTGDSIQIRDTAGSLDRFVQVTEGPYLGKNLLDNGNFQVNEVRNSTGVTILPFTGPADNSLCLNRWKYYQHSGSPSVVLKYPENEGLSYLQFEWSVMNVAQGLGQIVAHERTRKLQGRQVSFSFDAKGEIGTIGFAVVAYSGTADQPTHPFHTDWHTVGGAGTIPVLNTDWAYLGTAQIEALGTDWGRYKLENLTVPSNANNLQVLVWTDNLNIAVGETLSIREAQLELGDRATACELRPYGIEAWECMRYYQVYGSRLLYAHPRSDGLHYYGAALLSVPLRDYTSAIITCSQSTFNAFWDGQGNVTVGTSPVFTLESANTIKVSATQASQTTVARVYYSSGATYMINNEF